VAALRRQVRDRGLGERIRFEGARIADEVRAAYAAADVLVVPSREETYGMVVTEALAHGLPVIATEVGGLPETLGAGADGHRPGLLVAPGDPAALALALRTWLDDAELRRRLRRTAGERRTTLSGWAHTTDRIARVLGEMAG
jgi:glycosyltransferase involved in cell wall biosynthesis